VRNKHACYHCRLGKVRCAGGNPCTTCSKKGVECKIQSRSNPQESPLILEESIDPPNDNSALTQVYVSSAHHLASLSNHSTVITRQAIGQSGNVGLGQETSTKSFQHKVGEAYFTHFHHRWPILHASRLETHGTSMLKMSVDMINTWLGKDIATKRKETTLAIHRRLMNEVVPKLVSQISIKLYM
jgi:hypothetical protein